MEEQQVLDETKVIEGDLTSKAELPVAQFTPSAIATNSAIFEHIQRVSKMYATSQFVPECYRGKLADCIVAVSMAAALDVNPVMFLQLTYPVKGKIGFEGKLAAALVNTSGQFEQPLDYEIVGSGDDMKVTAWTTRRGGTKRIEASYSYQDAKSTGISSGNGWKNTPREQKLCYMAALQFCKRHCPERLLGMNSVEELEVIEVTERTEAKEYGAKLKK